MDDHTSNAHIHRRHDRHHRARKGVTRGIAATLTLGAALGAMILMAGATSAQEGPTLTVEPAAVDAAGDHELTVIGSGWTQPVVGVFPCAVPESGQLEDVQPSTCMIALANEVEPVDGAFEFTMTYPVAENGLAIVASNPPPDEGAETAGVIVTIATAEAAEQPAETLADTGSEIAILLTAALALIVAGLALSLLRRRAAPL